MTKETSVVERVWCALADQKRWRMPMIAPNWFWPAPTCSVAAVSVATTLARLPRERQQLVARTIRDALKELPPGSM